MDVSKYDLDGVWLTIEVRSERELEPFKFLVQPIVETGVKAAAKSPDEVTSLCIGAVVDWDLMNGPDPLPCNEETKRLYLTKFANYSVKTVNGVSPDAKQEELVASLTAKYEAETVLGLKANLAVKLAVERGKLNPQNLAGAISSFASRPDNFLKN